MAEKKENPTTKEKIVNKAWNKIRENNVGYIDRGIKDKSLDPLSPVAYFLMPWQFDHFDIHNTSPMDYTI